MKVTLYTKENCPNCIKLKGFLAANEIEVDDVFNIDENEEALERVKELGIMSMPVVIFGFEGSDSVIEGFNPSKVMEIYYKYQ